jgi:hypothetical protein
MKRSLPGALLLALFVGTGDVSRATQARVRVALRDGATDRPIPARYYLTTSANEPYSPAGFISYHKGNEHHFIADGPFDLDLPAGRYHLLVERGTEYRPATVTFDVSAGAPRAITLRLHRWIDMNARGWFSGDLHNHRPADEMPALLQAEDLNLAPTITDWIWEDRPRATPPPVTDAFRVVGSRHAYSVLDKEVERLEHGPGAVALLGLRAIVPFEGYRLHPPDAIYCERARRQGGYIDAEKIVWRDSAALAALGLIDFVGIVHNHFNRHDVELETDRWGMIPKWKPEFHTVAGMPLWSMAVYYHLLNCGFRLPVSAGSASGVKQAPLGHNRVYVKLAAPFSYQTWFEALKAGRSFGTNGPMLFLSVDGKEPGSELRSANATRTVRIIANASSPRPLDRLEIVIRGRVVHRASTPRKTAGVNHLRVEMDHTFDGNSWVAARVFERAGRTIRFAHTSPIYVDVGRPAPADDDARFFLDWIDREIRFYSAAPGFREPQHREEMLAFFRKARDVYARMK